MRKLTIKEQDNLIVLIMIFGFLLTILLSTIFGKSKKPIIYEESNEEIEYKNYIDSLKEVDEITLNYGDKVEVTVTVYNPVVAQCDDTPLITADNSKINLNKLNNGDLKWIAVSRDLLKQGISYGDKVKIKSKKDPTINGIYEVHDTMHKRWKKRIDLLSPENKTLGKWEDVELELLAQD